MLQQYREQQRPGSIAENHINYQQHRQPHRSGTSHYYQQPPPPPQQRPFRTSDLYGSSNMPSLIHASTRPNSRTSERQWPTEDNTYCDLDSTDSSLCWSSYLVPVDYGSIKSRKAPVNTANDSSLDLSAIDDLSIDQLHTLEHSLETSLAEISSILPDNGSTQPYSSFRKDETPAKLLPRNSTPNLRGPQTLSIHKSSDNAINNIHRDYQYAPSTSYRRNTISHPVSSGYNQMQHQMQQRAVSVPQPVSSGEYSEYIQRLAFEGDTTNDSSVLDSTFASCQRRNLLSSNAQPIAQVTNRRRPACIGQDSSLVTVQDLSTFTHVNDSTASEVQLEDPGSDSSDFESRVPSGDSNPEMPNMTMDSDATGFMENPMSSRPVTYKQKGGRYKTVTNRLRKVGQQIKNKGRGNLNLKTLAVL